MFLSRIDLNPMRREARRLLGDPQSMHAVIMRACSPEEGERVLWRVDEDGDSVALYLVSPREPNLEKLQVDAGWLDGGGPRTADYTSFLDRLEAGQRYAFRFVGNPTHLVTKNGVKKQTAHVTVEHQKNWFLGKTAQAGFKVCETSMPDPVSLAIEPDDSQKALDLVVSRRETRVFRRQGKTVTIAMATFAGTLQVTDATSLRVALTGGIGRAKAYGCGLLTLAASK